MMLLQHLRHGQRVIFGVARSPGFKGLIHHSHSRAVCLRPTLVALRSRRPSSSPCTPHNGICHAANDEIVDQRDTEANERTVFVGGLDALSGEDAVMKYFSSFGEVEGCNIVRTIRGASKCFGFVRFATDGVVEEVLKQEHVIEEAPVNVCRTTKYRVVHIAKLPSNVTSEHLAEHFARFGQVEQARIPETMDRRRGYGLITFSTQEEAMKATEQANQMIQLGSGGAQVELTVRLHAHAKKDVESNRILLNALPYETTAEELRDFFGKTGKLKAVDLALNAKHRKCVAFLTFTDSGDVDKLADEGEVLYDGVTVPVHKADIQAKLQTRHRSVFVDNLPLDITEEELTQYFMRFGKVRRARLPLDDDTNCHMGFGVVKFMKSPDVNSVINYAPHVIGTHKICVRRLGLILPSSQRP